MSLSADRAFLVGFGLEALLYGLYVGAFATSIVFLTWQRRTRNVNWLMLTLSSLLYVAATVHIAFTFYIVLSAFITRRDAPGGPAALVGTAYYQLKSISAMYVCDILGNLVLLHRCWLVWERRVFAILLPALLASAFVVPVTAILSSVELGRQPPNNTGFAGAVGIFAEASLILSLVTNLSLTLIISGRIYYMAKGLDQTQARKYRTVVGMVVESGAIFSAAQIALVVMYARHSEAIWIMTNSAPQIYCLAPTLIIVRVGLGRTSGTHSEQERSVRSMRTSRLRHSNHPIVEPDALSPAMDDGPSASQSINYGQREEIYKMKTLV
ncbi:hypothetical protein OE88DRAFT_759508 [Heliocybe sulcata]|uniref:G-protein coupled receptors family 1 profile domain-containing protein n=1 Tax=Heliocybe sulcata TaxID=5364 RepID=A0A5C3N2C1_9AGAM|nr:hypothetical protein OE88DRAFT_759508 [Heliocybe sulcata]